LAKARWWRFLGALALAAAPLAAWAGGDGAWPWQERWLSRFNAARERAGLLPFRPAPVLQQVAQLEAEERAAGRRTPLAATSERLRRVGYSAHAWSETQVVDRRDAATALDRERTVLDGRYRDLGVGAAPIDGGTVYVLLFGWHQGDFFATATAPLRDRARVAAEMLARVNGVRRRAGLAPLRPSAVLDRVSQQHADDMLRREYFDHRTPEGLGPTDRARADGYGSGVGENLVEERFSAEEAMAAWLASPGHRRNILDPGCRELGLGLAVGAGYAAAPGGYRVIWVQSFGRGG
jgi:hypothetical protein